MTSSTFTRLSISAAFAGAIVILLSAAASGSEPRVSRANANGLRADAPQLVAPTRIEIDNQAREIRFYINGEQITVLDSVGFHGATTH
ncbi:hypothetical protein [Rhizobium sullae]|uniref:Uncharacterized protein n=1 Tax=Rhizobium sullae TaxID=50338 RepID=A0A2N0DAB9_RHISU|nr:hypothetical protein [Rhizobium sullae]PKA43029.1 hypothetical protein CWR43_13245 [Rhizobium sullae]UWU15520.1 hypothetical protein N2599_05815 [Rhizobium sullae]